MTDAWRTQFPDAVELPRWGDLLRQNVAIFDLDFDAILAAMYAMTYCAEVDCYLCVPPDPGIESAAPRTSESVVPGAGESALSGTAPTEALHTFTLDSGASRSFFRDSTTFTPLSRPVAVSLINPSGGPLLAHSSTVLPCPAAPSGLLLGLHLPSFSTNLRVTHSTCSRTGRHVATFTHWPGSSLYTLTTTSPPVTAFGQVFSAASRSSPASAPCSYRPLSHETLLWHHRLGHPSLPHLRDRGGVFSSELQRAFCRAEGIRQTFTLPASPQQNGIAERRIGMVMDVARTSMIHAAAPHFMWPFAVQYAAHQINLQPRVSLPETTPTLRWTGKIGNASVFRFYHPTSRRILSSQDDVFDLSVSYYRLFPYRTAPLPSSPLFLAPDPVEPVEVAVSYGAARGAELGVAESEGAEPGGAEPERVEPGGAEPGGAESGGAKPGGAEPERAESGGPPGVPSRWEPLSLQRLREWYARRCSRTTGATGPSAGGASRARGAAGAGAAEGASGAGAAGGAASAGAAGAAGPGGAGAGGPGTVGGPAGVGAAGGAGEAGPGGARTGGTGVAGAGGAAGFGAVGARAVAIGGAAGAGAVGGTGAGGAVGIVAGDPGVEGTGAVSIVSGGAARPRPYYVPLLQQVLGLPPSTGPTPPLLSPPPVQSQSQLQPASPQPGPSPYSGPTTGLTERREPASLAALVDFAAACRLDYAASLVAESESASVCPLSFGGKCALRTDVLEDRQEEFECSAATLPHLVSMLSAPKKTRMHQTSRPHALTVKRPPGSPPVFKAHYVARGFSQRQGRDYELLSFDFSTAFLQGSLHEEIWLRRPPGFTGSFPASTQWSLRQPVYGLRQAPREWHDTLRTNLAALGFAPSAANMSLFLRTDTTLLPFYVLMYVDDLVFATADTEALAHVLQRFGYTYSSPQSTPLPTGHSLSPPSSDESVESSGPYLELVGCLMFLMTCTRPDLAYPLSILARSVAPGRHRKEHMDAAKRVLRYLCTTSGMGLVLGGRDRVVLTGHADASRADDLTTQRSSQGYTFSLGSGSVSWRTTRSSSVLSSSCEAEIYAGAMAAQELRWLTYLLTDLGEPPRSPPVLYIDYKAMIALCLEHRLEHITKHIALRYFLARELQQRGQLCLTYVASRANTVDVFTEALQPCDHQRFCTVLGLVTTVPHLLTS
ncbi:unnamed protein product [Closterium sp. NIES-53]